MNAKWNLEWNAPPEIRNGKKLGWHSPSYREGGVYYHHSDWHIKWVYFCHVLKRWCKHAAMRFGNQLWWSSALAKCSWWEAADSSIEVDQHQTVEEGMANWRFDTCIIDGRSEYNGVTKSLNPEKQSLSIRTRSRICHPTYLFSCSWNHKRTALLISKPS